MTSYCQNGWSVVGRDRIHSVLVPGSDGVRLPVRKGDAGDVLIWAAELFNRNVERLHRGWCWGYAVRAIRGKTSGYSNHAGGLALDFNAPIHGLGARGTYNYRQLKQIRAILKASEVDGKPVLRFGVFYNGRPDPMHVEIIGSPAQVKKLAARIRASRVTSIDHVLKPGDKSELQVKLLQKALNKHTVILRGIVPLKVDGDYGNATKRAVLAWKVKSGKFAKSQATNTDVGPKTAETLKIKYTGKK